MNAAKGANMNIRDGLRKIGAAFLSTKEVSSQECVYRCMPELWMKRIFPATVFVSTDVAEKRIRITKTKQELDDLDDESTDIFQSNIIQRYTIRPTSIPIIDNLCLAQFAVYYYKDYRKENSETVDAQPEVLTEKLVEVNHSCNKPNHDALLPEKIKLLNTKEIIKCGKVKAVIRYHRPNKTKEPELFFHHFLMLDYSSVCVSTLETNIFQRRLIQYSTRFQRTLHPASLQKLL